MPAHHDHRFVAIAPAARTAQRLGGDADRRPVSAPARARRRAGGADDGNVGFGRLEEFTVGPHRLYRPRVAPLDTRNTSVTPTRSERSVSSARVSYAPRAAVRAGRRHDALTGEHSGDLSVEGVCAPALLLEPELALRLARLRPGCGRALRRSRAARARARSAGADARRRRGADRRTAELRAGSARSRCNRAGGKQGACGPHPRSPRSPGAPRRRRPEGRHGTSGFAERRGCAAAWCFTCCPSPDSDRGQDTQVRAYRIAPPPRRRRTPRRFRPSARRRSPAIRRPLPYRRRPRAR